MKSQTSGAGYENSGLKNMNTKEGGLKPVVGASKRDKR